MENTEEIYTDFARVYDELMDNTPYEMWCNRLDQLIASYGVSRPTRDAEGILDSERNLVVDLGCGTGLLGLLLLQRQSELTITGIDIQPAAVALAERAAAENRLTDRLTFRCIDLRQVRQHFSTGSFDLVVCNPPYYPPASGKVSADNARRTARSETEASLADICAAASYLLRWGGKFCLVHKPERLTDTACALREAGMEPKRLRFVQNRPDTAPSLFLIEGCRGGKPGVDIQPPLLLQTDTGAPTGELNVIYFRDQEV